MSVAEKDLLDLKNNMEFILDIFRGNKEYFIQLKKWYDRRSLDNNNPIEIEKKKLYLLIEYTFNNIIKEKNNNGEKIELKKKEDSNLLENKNDKVQYDLNNIKEILKKHDKEFNQVKINEFIRDVEIFLVNESLYYANLKITCIDEKNKLNNINITYLNSIVNDLYSFKNLSIYRKISSTLIKKIVFVYKDNLIYRNGKILSYDNDNINNIIDFFIYIKKNTSELLHFSNISKKILKSLTEGNNKLDNNKRIKDSNKFFIDLEKATTEMLIETLINDTPLLFFDENIIEGKGNLDYKINSLLSKIQEKNKCEIDNNKFIEKLEELEKKKNFIKINNFLNDLEDKDLIIKFYQNCDIIDEKKKIAKEIEKIEIIKEEILEKIKKLSEYKAKTSRNYFSFKDFIRIYINDRNNGLIKLYDPRGNPIKITGSFNPYSICKALLANHLQDNADFFDLEDEYYKTLLKND